MPKRSPSSTEKSVEIAPKLIPALRRQGFQLLLGHSKLDSTVRYLGIEIDDALEMSEQLDV